LKSELCHIPTHVYVATALEIVCDLDKILIGIADVDGAEFAHGTGAFDRTLFDMNSQLRQVADHFFQRRKRDEAEVGRSTGWMGGLRIELVSALVEIDPLIAKPERGAAFEGDEVHAEDFGIEVGCGMDVGDGKDDVVQLFQGKGHCCIMDPRGELWEAANFTGVVLHFAPACGSRRSTP
jgi:hypothetical protein